MSLFFWGEVPFFILFGTLVTLIPLAALRILAATVGAKQKEAQFPHLTEKESKREEQEKPRDWRTSVSSQNE